MSVQRRIGGLPLAVYVVALLLLPLTAVGMFSLREFDRNNESADHASQVAEAVALGSIAASGLVPAESELIASLANLAGSPFPELDPEGVLAATGPRLDVVIDQLQSALERAGSAPATLESLAQIDARLEAARVTVADGTASSATVIALYEALVGHLTDLVKDSDRAVTFAEVDGVDTDQSIRQLPVLTAVLVTAQQEFHLVGVDSLGAAEMSDREMLGGAIRHADALSVAVGLDPVGVESLRSARAAVRGGSLESAAVTTDQVLAAHLGYLQRVDRFDAVQRQDFRSSIELRALDAASRNQSAVLLLLVVGVWSLMFGLVVMRSFAAPLTRLRLQAERISRGELNAEPLPVAGPSDVRKVTDAVNEMAGTLSLVEDHMDALAVADLNRLPELDALPGHVGASMRQSMERVAALTSRLKSSEARLAQEARVDHLTGLPNRFAVLEYLERLTRIVDGSGVDTEASSPTTGVMFLDVDGFKSVNDMHGHAVGDVVLRDIAQRLRGSIRDVDFVARLGGDEFLVIVADMPDADRLVGFGERMIAEVEQPYTVGDQLFAVSASVGVTVVRPGDAAMAVIARADAAVYQAKRRGRRRVEIFDQELQRSIEHQAEIELALRQAIQHGELRMYLQPLADLSTGLTAGAEALVRWERPGYGLIPPNDFIPIAERSGLIFDLERWMLASACSRIAEWQLTGRAAGMRLAVNISGRHLVEGNLLADLDAALAATGADPNLLEIELTESQLLDDVARARSVLSAVRDRGVKVAIDDFGTGYSSMTYLQKLPVDVVKIDRSFVESAATNRFDSTIIDTVVTIGAALDLDVVAEGIETIEQLAFMVNAGVTLGQGYLLCRPMPAEEAETVMFGGPLFDRDRLAHVGWPALPPVIS